MNKENSLSDYEIQIERMAYGGKGIGYLDGQVIFVPHAVVGDRVRVALADPSGSSNKKFQEGQLLEIIQPSPHRQKVSCPYLELEQPCGGCFWQGIPEDIQQEWKKSFVLSQLQRARLLPESIENKEVHFHPSPAAWHYRNRIMLRVHIIQGQWRLGFFARQSHKLVPIKRCSIACESLNQVIEHLSQINLDGAQKSSQKETRFRLELQEMGTNQVTALLFPAEPSLTAKKWKASRRGERSAEAERFHQILSVLKSIPNLVWAGLVYDQQKAPSYGLDQQRLEGIEHEFLTKPGSFFQVNLSANHKLRARVFTKVRERLPAGGRILDIFCGSGNLSLPLAPFGYEVYGVESNPSSIQLANEKVLAHAWTKTSYISMDAGAFLRERVVEKRQSQGDKNWDLLIADPPRQGMKDCVSSIVELEPQYILYVSCDPATLVRDVAQFVKKNYVIESIDIFDFFPQTYHVETLIILSRSP